MTKVLIINTVRFRLNGMTSVILNYYRNMDKTDMQIDFAVPNEISKEYRAELEANGSKIFYIPRKSNPLSYQKKLRKVISENKYDIVHVHGNSSMMIIDLLPARLEKVPVRIAHCHNTTCSHRVINQLLMPIFNRCYTHRFACGNDAGRWLYGKKPFVELKNGIELEKYAYSPQIREIYRKKINAQNRIVLGHVGNFTEQKNHTFLLDWFAELIRKNDNYLLLMISDGALFEQMKQKAKDLNICGNVLFLGKTTEVNNYLQSADIFVLPSLFEGLPVVLVEAQASGLPCLVSDTVSKEADLTGTLKFIPITETEKWVNTVEYTASQLKDFDRQDVCDRNCKKIAENGYDICKNADFMRKLYLDYLGKK